VDESQTIRETNVHDNSMTHTETNHELIRCLQTIVALLDTGLWMDAMWQAKAMLMAIERGMSEPE